MFVAPVIIMPIFNKFEPLEDGPLKKAIKDYADSQGFRMKGIFKMDGSRRSAKTNAFFTGFGRFRRIVLFDTLIDQHSVDELVSILAHEMGHYRMGHITKHLVLSFLSTGLMFFLMSLFVNNRELFNAFKMDHTSIYAGLLLFGFVYIPVDRLIAIITNMISRAHEYAADAYAVNTFKKPETMISALKKLAVKNLSDLSPHPFKVVLDYTHPPVIYRINAIRKLIDSHS
jgi:STE24 endopeptidase